MPWRLEDWREQLHSAEQGSSLTQPWESLPDKARGRVETKGDPGPTPLGVGSPAAFSLERPVECSSSRPNSDEFSCNYNNGSGGRLGPGSFAAA